MRAGDKAGVPLAVRAAGARAGVPDAAGIGYDHAVGVVGARGYAEYGPRPAPGKVAAPAETCGVDVLVVRDNEFVHAEGGAAVVDVPHGRSALSGLAAAQVQLVDVARNRRDPGIVFRGGAHRLLVDPTAAAVVVDRGQHGPVYGHEMTVGLGGDEVSGLAVGLGPQDRPQAGRRAGLGPAKRPHGVGIHIQACGDPVAPRAAAVGADLKPVAGGDVDIVPVEKGARQPAVVVRPAGNDAPCGSAVTAETHGPVARRSRSAVARGGDDLRGACAGAAGVSQDLLNAAVGPTRQYAPCGAVVRAHDRHGRITVGGPSAGIEQAGETGDAYLGQSACGGELPRVKDVPARAANARGVEVFPHIRAGNNLAAVDRTNSGGIDGSCGAYAYRAPCARHRQQKSGFQWFHQGQGGPLRPELQQLLHRHRTIEEPIPWLPVRFVSELHGPLLRIRSKRYDSRAPETSTFPSSRNAGHPYWTRLSAYAV